MYLFAAFWTHFRQAITMTTVSLCSRNFKNVKLSLEIQELDWQLPPNFREINLAKFESQKWPFSQF